MSTAQDLVARAQRGVARRVFGRAPEREHWLRQEMYRDVDHYIRALGPERHDALEVSGRFYDGYPWRRYEQWSYPAFDLCAPGEVEPQFSVVLCDQVLEHVVDPRAAARTLAALCVPGGHVIVGVPFLVRIHPAPKDYWRFTPAGLRVLLEGAGLDVPHVRAWGNRLCVRANFSTWPKKPWFGSDRNEERFPTTVWAIARKPAETAA